MLHNRTNNVENVHHIKLNIIFCGYIYCYFLLSAIRNICLHLTRRCTFNLISPMTSIDVERSFSQYKNLLSNNRRTFHMRNLKKILEVQCNNLTGII